MAHGFDQDWLDARQKTRQTHPPAARIAPSSTIGPITCPRCGKACGNRVDEATRQTISCQFCHYPKPVKPSKHRNRKTAYKGILFDSAKEAARYQTLALWEQVGAIRDLRRQVSFDLYAPNGERICQYRADFCYFSLESGKQVIEDVKSPWTRKLREYRIKAKWMAAQSNPISEV